METTKTKKTHKSKIKIVVYFKRKKDGTPFTAEEITKIFNRKEEYKYTYFPKKGGGYITDHERGFDAAHETIRQHITNDNVLKACIFLCSIKTGIEERAANYIHGSGWEFFHRPEFVTTAAGHRYISRYQSLPIFHLKEIKNKLHAKALKFIYESNKVIRISLSEGECLALSFVFKQVQIVDYLAGIEYVLIDGL